MLGVGVREHRGLRDESLRQPQSEMGRQERCLLGTGAPFCHQGKSPLENHQLWHIFPSPSRTGLDHAPFLSPQRQCFCRGDIPPELDVLLDSAPLKALGSSLLVKPLHSRITSQI